MKLPLSIQMLIGICLMGMAQARILNTDNAVISLTGSGYSVDGDVTNLKIIESDMTGSEVRLEQIKVSGDSQTVSLGGTAYLASKLTGHQDVVYAQGTTIGGSAAISVSTHSSAVKDGAGNILVQNSDGVVLGLGDGVILAGGKLGGHAKVGQLPIHNGQTMFGCGVDKLVIANGTTATLKDIEASVEYSIDMVGATLVLDNATLIMGQGAPKNSIAEFTVSNNAHESENITIEIGKDTMRGLELESRAIVDGTVKGTGELRSVRMQGGRLEIGHTGSNGLGQMNLTNVETSGTTWHFNISTDGAFQYASANTNGSDKFSQLKVEKHGNYGENVTISIGYVDATGATSDKSNLQTFERGASLTLIDTSNGSVHGSYYFDIDQLPAVAEGMVWYTYDLFTKGTITVVDDIWGAVSLASGDGLISIDDLPRVLHGNLLADSARFANTLAVAGRTTGAFGNTILAHADDYRMRASNFWMGTYYSRLDRASTGSRTGYKSSTMGYAVGMDTVLKKYNAVVGVALGSSKGDVTPSRGNHTYTAGSIDQDGVQFGLYGRINQLQPAFHEHSINVEAYLTYGQYDCRSKRSARGTGEQVIACWDERAWALGMRFSRNYAWRHGITMTPFAGLEYTMADMDKVREMGYTATDYSCTRVHRNFALQGGVRLQRTLQLRNGQRLIPFGSVALGFDLFRQHAKVVGRHAAGTATNEETHPGRLSLEFCMGSSWIINPRWSAEISYSLDVRDSALDQQINLSASKSF